MKTTSVKNLNCLRRKALFCWNKQWVSWQGGMMDGTFGCTAGLMDSCRGTLTLVNPKFVRMYPVLELTEVG